MTDPTPLYRQRPTAVTVMAILNFIFGGLAILGLVCGGLVLLMGASLLKSLPPPPGGGPNPVTEVTGMFKSIPGYIPYMVVSSFLGVIMAIVLIVAGVGLLKMRPWARWACVVYGLYAVLGGLVGLVYTMTVVNPAVQRWQEDFMRRQGVFGPSSSGASNDVSAVGGAIFGMAYGVSLLVVMFLPHVSAAFAVKPLPQTADLPPYYPQDRTRPGPSGGDSFQSPDERRWQS